MRLNCRCVCTAHFVSLASQRRFCAKDPRRNFSQRSISLQTPRGWGRGSIRNLIRSFLKGKKSQQFPCVSFDSVIIHFDVTTPGIALRQRAHRLGF
ncbi:hypothetical protein CDAR_561501 [Caerostris darwini]|uniref:Secreted protein n=1 Tax=Caerostris darwini TaxID=1538125 RepID=A0AAV4SSS2_9ARAC|nr:hypothetical protein CDAR_561501 [Caerostris darwini]